MRRNSIPREWQTYEQHGLSLPDLPAGRSFPSSRVGHLPNGKVSAPSRASVGVSFNSAGAPHILRNLRKSSNVRD